MDRYDYGPVALSGTSEMAMGGLFMNKVVRKPRKLAAISRCYRAETSHIQKESGIYRVHQFTKVEMFGILPEDSISASSSLLQEFLDIQDCLFGDLGLAYQILDMAPYELGNPAYRKYDIEAYLPGRHIRGEISSTSNCTDYQSRRLNIRNTEGGFCHTVNGTACAVPRMIMAIVEQMHSPYGKLSVPERLVKYMDGQEVVGLPDKKDRLSHSYFHSPKYFHTAKAKIMRREEKKKKEKKKHSSRNIYIHK